MANHAWVVFRKNIDLAILEGYLKTYNVERFGGCLVIAREDTGISVLSPEGRRFYYWLRSKRSLEWAHTYGDVGWWISESLASYMARKFQSDCVIHDEGIADSSMKPDFDLQYPTVVDWIGEKGFLKSFLIQLHPERNYTDPSYWKII